MSHYKKYGHGRNRSTEEILNDNQERKERIERQRAQEKQLVFRYYGNECVCCGSKDRLQIDHIYGTYCSVYKGLPRAGPAMYRSLILKDFPTGFQVLCAPCNQSKGPYRHCILKH